MRSFESVDEKNIEDWLQSDVCELGFQHLTYTDIANTAAKQKVEEDGGNESEEEGESVRVSHCMVLQCVDTLLDYMGHRGFEYSDITAVRKICTAVRSLNSSQEQATIRNYFFKCHLCKKCKVICAAYIIFWIIHVFDYLCVFSPPLACIIGSSLHM
jgi:hypothetical protein